MSDVWINPLLENNLGDYPHHAAAVGIPHEWVPEHMSEDCAWCDAIRWRRFITWVASEDHVMAGNLIQATSSLDMTDFH